MVKGIVLAGGTGSRLYPLTHAVNKHLLPIYNKPMIYYPLSVLMLAGVKDIAIITTYDDQEPFYKLLGNGSDYGIRLTSLIQYEPNGLAEAFIIAEDFLRGDDVILVLGDNLFFGSGFTDIISNVKPPTIFAYKVSDPERYGVVEIKDGQARTIVEKPLKPASSFAIPGLYFLDSRCVDYAKQATPSDRGELEITSVLHKYMLNGGLSVQELGRGIAWFDCGTFDSMLNA